MTQHHCPQCYGIAQPRCIELGHYVLCEEHQDPVANARFGECHRCVSEARRVANAEGKMKGKATEDMIAQKKSDKADEKIRKLNDKKFAKYQERRKPAASIHESVARDPPDSDNGGEGSSKRPAKQAKKRRH